MAGTKVLMADGTTKPIEHAKIGDRVLAADPATGEVSGQEVTALIQDKSTKQLVAITVSPDDSSDQEKVTIAATAGHPFWVPRLRRWVHADELLPGMWLQTSVGTYIQITSTRKWAASEHVHNLSVRDFHTYYVVTGKVGVLVHNTTGEPNCNGIFEASPKHGTSQRGNVAPGPTDGQAALDNSVGISPNTTRRVGIDKENGEFVIFDETHPGQGVFHGHVRNWDELSQQQQNALVKAGLATRRGKILQ